MDEGAERQLTDERGGRWTARLVSHGRTSDYLNARVHRPIVQFDRNDGPGPSRYAALPQDHEGLATLSEKDLTGLFEAAKAH